MKHIIKYLSILFAVTILFTACNEDAIESLTGKYPAPNEFTFTSLTSLNVVKQAGGIRTVSLKLSSNDAALSVNFVVNDFFLKENGYTPALTGNAKNGNYSSAGFTQSGASEKAVTAGVIHVKIGIENHYTISGTLQLADNSFVRVSFTGEIVFEADPPAFAYTIEVTKPYSWTADGTTYTPVPGSQLNKITVSSEGQNIAYFEIVTEENPSSLTGNYPVKSVNSLERAIVQGQYLNLAWFGMPFDMIIESGSYYMDGDTKMFVREGNINITDNGGILSFSGSNLAIQDITTTTSFGNLPNKGSINITEATKESAGGSSTHPNLFSASAVDLSLFGLSGFTVTVKIATSGLTVNEEQGPMGATYTYAGSGQYISFDFSRDAASLPAGVYNVVNNTTAAVNDCLAGYPSFFGPGFMGSFVGNVTNGVATEEVITGGTVEVTDSGINFNLTTASGTISGNYSGAISI